MDIDGIVAEMPKTDNPFAPSHSPEHQYYDAAIYHQCQLLAEQGYRPVPSEEEIVDKIPIIHGLYMLKSKIEASKMLRQWLLERDNDKER